MATGDHMWPPQDAEAHRRHLENEPPEGEVFEYEAAPYAMFVQATLPADRWSALFFSWLSFKGFVAGMHFVENTHLYATQAGGRVWATMIVGFSSPRALGQWLDEGYPMEEMLHDIGIPDEDIRVALVRDVA